MTALSNQETYMPALSGAVTVTAVYAGPSAQVWFAGGERVGYDLKARAIVAAEDAPLRILLRREGDVAHAVTFLPGFPDGSFGWAKVLPYLPNAIVGLERTTRAVAGTGSIIRVAVTMT